MTEVNHTPQPNDTPLHTLRAILLKKAEHYQAKQFSQPTSGAVAIALMEVESAFSQTAKFHPGEM